MDIYFATFNCTKSDIAKARREFNEHFGKGSYIKYISRFVRSGIMSIFGETPNEHTAWFVKRLAEIVNKRVGERAEKAT